MNNIRSVRVLSSRPRSGNSTLMARLLFIWSVRHAPWLSANNPVCTRVHYRVRLTTLPLSNRNEVAVTPQHPCQIETLSKLRKGFYHAPGGLQEAGMFVFLFVVCYTSFTRKCSVDPSPTVVVILRARISTMRLNSLSWNPRNSSSGVPYWWLAYRHHLPTRYVSFPRHTFNVW